MRNFLTLLFGLIAVAAAPYARAQQTWTEGRHYVLIQPPQATNVSAGKVEVMEVFSYACPACNQFRPFMRQIAMNLPANAELVYLPAAFNPSEDWPMFQRAYLAALALGIAEETHEAMYDAIWGPDGELAVIDTRTRRLKRTMPTIEDAARFYARETDVSEEKFLDVANSFSVNLKMKAADTYIMAARVPGTPTLIVNGKYRLNLDAVQSVDAMIELIDWLVTKESSNQ